MAEKIILCFDGTGNDPSDARHDTDPFALSVKEDSSVSNVFKLHLLFGGDMIGGQRIPGQLSIYYSGVGTYGRQLRRVFNQALALENQDVGRILRTAVKDLARWEREHPGIQYELFLFGFSRGAALARRFASVLRHFDELKQAANVRFLGVFDTVASIGKPNLHDDTKPVSDVVFENGTLSPQVQEALHLLSLDEQRIAFEPVLMNKDPRVTEVWFPGVHSDIGGGFRFDGLSDVSLQFMLDEIERREIGLQLLDPMDVDIDKVNAQCENCDLDLADLIIQPEPLGKMHPKKRPPIATRITLADRQPRINVADKPSKDENDLPIIHLSAIERIHADRTYRPKTLRKPHRVLYPYGSLGQELLVRWAGLHEHLMVGERPAKPLKIGETQTIQVYANLQYNRSGVLLEKGAKYIFNVPPNQKWVDASIACDEKGWDRDTQALGLKEIFIRLSEGKRRYPSAKWFELIGAIGANDDHLFPVTTYLFGNNDFVPTLDGELYLFANDLNRMYGNNRGFITVKISRVG